MSSEIKNQSTHLQANWLQHLQTDVQNLSPNKINMIKGYLGKTGLHTRMIGVFEKMRAHLKNDDSQALYQKYTSACKDFNDYLTNRITWLTKPDKSSPNDPWYRLGASSGENELIETSFHIQDILNDIELILKYEIDEGCETATEETQELFQMISDNHSKLENKQSDTEQNSMRKIEELRKAINSKNFKDAKKIFTDISSILMQ